MSSSTGDWICSDSRCGYSNFSKRIRCGECDKPRKSFPSTHQRSGDHDRGGGGGRDKGKGLFSPDDWSCKNCGNINWARRTTCNVCNTSRFNKMGERTGYGGGFMERDEVIEYKPRSSRDDDRDEYDEFGRKKKQFRGIQGTNGSGNYRDGSPVVQRQQGVDQEDEEEDESGDDADLVKYDIWDASDEEVGELNPTVSKTRSNDASDSSSDSSASDSDSSSSSVASQASAPTIKGHSRGSSRASSSSGSSSSHHTDDDDDDADEKEAGLNSTRRGRPTGRDRRTARHRSRSPLSTTTAHT